MAVIYIGTAGWSMPAGGDDGLSHLERYARRFNAVEINSSFHREHRAPTYRRWAESTPPEFRFSVKLSKQFLQVQKLAVTAEDLKRSLDAIFELGPKLGVLLVQLPPSLEFQTAVAKRFFKSVRSVYKGALALEPRHASWALPKPVELLEGFGVSKVDADPERCVLPKTLQTRLSRKLRYFRLHGSPVIYRSRYSLEYIGQVWEQMRKSKAEDTWCIFDNTTLGHGLENAEELRRLQPSTEI